MPAPSPDSDKISVFIFQVTNWLTDYMELTTSSEPANRSATQEFSNIFWNPKIINYRVKKVHYWPYP
jgi:hypothetical protein